MTRITVYRPPHVMKCPRCKGRAIKIDADRDWECTKCWWSEDPEDQERFENEQEKNNVQR